MVWSSQERSAEEPLRLSGKPFWSSLSIKSASQGERQGKNSCCSLGAGAVCSLSVNRFYLICGEHQHVNKGNLSGTQKVNGVFFGPLCGHSG